MDSYTDETRQWLDQRFSLTDENGVYVAHQPIYGFRKSPCEPNMIMKYTITYQIMQALSHLKFSTLIDIGGAEGYKSAMARQLFGASVRSADLSAAACHRAKAIFDIDGEPIDIHSLPYEDESYDVVVCSETLEHVPDIEQATRELLRVCRKAVVITVPHEPPHIIERNIRENIPHAHIHSLNTDSFDFVLDDVDRIIAKTYHNPLLIIAAEILDAVEREQLDGYPPWLIKAYNWLTPLLRLCFGKRSAAALIKLDDFLANTPWAYGGMSFILVKDQQAYQDNPQLKVTTLDIIDFSVPHHSP